MKLRKYNLLIVLILLSFTSSAQYAFYTVMRGDVELNSPARISVDIGIPVNIIGPWAMVPSEAAFTTVGLFLTNNGLIYDENEYRYIHRALGISVPVRLGAMIKKKFYLGTGMNFNFNFHYKQTTFDYGTRLNESLVVTEYFSKQINLFYPSIELSAGISLHGVGRFSIRLQTFPGSLLNQAYVDEAGLKPYETLNVTQNFRILLSYNSGL